MSRRTLSRTAKRLDPFLNLSRKAITGGRSDALTAHSGLDYIVAHDTSNPTVNRNGTYYSYNFGVIGGAGVDESNNILAMLNTIGAAGGGRVVIRAADPADPIHFAKTVSCYYSNVHIVFPPGQLITFEDKASLRIMGDYAQITRKVDGTAMKLHVDSTVVSNETVLELSATDTALMDAEANPALRIVRVGDKIVVRGQNDASGKSIEKDTSFVKALAKVGSYWQITCTDELDYTFKPTYPASEWPADLTTGTTIYVIEGSLLTVNSAVNDTSITVADGTVFAVGDLIEVGDNRNEYAMNSSAITGAGNPYKNPANLEQRQVVGISGNVLTLDNALVRSTSTTYYAFAALMVPVVNSTIVGARISYVADGIRSANALQITYALDCHIYDCYVDGSGGRRGHGLRISYSYKCTAHRNRIENPKYSGSGEGYGITIYYATKILVDHNYVSGCRHNFLLQLATESIVSSNYSINDLISGIDLHGVRSKRCVIQDNHVTRSKLQDSDGSTKSGGIRIGNTSHSGGDDENLIEGNYISGYRGYNNTDGNGIDIFAASSGNIIRNNVIEHCYNGLRFGLNSKQITPVQFIDNTIVEGNVFRNCENRAVEIIAAPTYDNVNSNGKFSQITFINNISDGNNRHFEFTGVVTTLGITDVVCVGNQIINPTNVTTTYYGISAKYVDGFVHVYDNNVSKAQRGIYLQGNGVCHVIGNKTANTVQSDPFTDGGGNTSVNYVDAMTGAGLSSPDFLADVTITGTDPQLAFIETDAAANNRRWDFVANGEQFRARAVDDANSTATAFLAVDRTLNVIDTITLTATNINLTGIVTVTGAVSGSAFTTDVSVTNVSPQYIWVESGAAANNTRWDILVTGEVMYFRAVNDANSLATAWMTVNRTANTIDSVSVDATLLALNGLTTFNQRPYVKTNGADLAGIWLANSSGTARALIGLNDDDATPIMGDYIGGAWRTYLNHSGEMSIAGTGGLGPQSGVALAIGGIARVNQASSLLKRADWSVGSGIVTFNGYDDGGAAYLPANFDFLSIALRYAPTGTTILNITSTGAAVTGDLSASDDLTVTGDADIGGNLVVAGTTNVGSGGGKKFGYSVAALTTGSGTIQILPNDSARANGCAVFGFVAHSAGGVGSAVSLSNGILSGTPATFTFSGDTMRIQCTSGGKVEIAHLGPSGATSFEVVVDIYWA